MVSRFAFCTLHFAFERFASHTSLNVWSQSVGQDRSANNMEWAARQFYSLPAIVERMARSRTGLWWNLARNLGYHLALRNFGDVGFNPEILAL